MYTIKSKILKVVAIILILNIFLQIVFPIASYALTSGPSQPEVQSFEPVGTTEMVDLFTGDFTYNIPLFELPGPNGGYPFNLSYNAGISMDQEASWVGLGWNLNPGVINRQMRGFPDDFNGDAILRDQDIRPNVTFGVGAGGSVEIFGGDLIKGQLSLGIGIYYNNYKGVGYNVSPGLSMQTNSQGLDAGVGFHFSMDSQEGVGVTPSLSLISHGTENDNTFSVGATYNSKRGLTGMSMGFTAQSQDKKKNKADNNSKIKGGASIGGNSTLSVASQGYSPQVGIPMQGNNLSVTLKTGGSIYGVFGSAYVNGFFNTQYLASKHSSAKGYGYMYLQNANSSSLLDFNREKDGMITKNSLNLAGTTMTHDIYTVAGQGISGMYRPFRSDVGVLYDQSINSETAGGAIGFEAGAGMPHIGGDLSINYSTNKSGKWTDDNSAASIYQFISSNPNGDPLFEPYYFKTYGEHTSDSTGTYGELHYIGNTSPVRIDLLKGGSFLDRTYSAQQTFTGAEGAGVTISNINTTEKREPRNLTVQTLTIKDLTNSRAGVNNEIINHFDIDYYTSSTPVIAGTSTFDYRSGTPSDLNRPINKLSHIAGLTAANPDGTRYIYGLPAYNNTQVECQFTVLPPSDSCTPTVDIDYSGSPSKINYSSSSYNNSDKYYSKTTVPAYAHSYLLTSILGADYIDADNIPGPSVGDLGYWVKFNYIKTTATGTDYNWRVPFKGANYSKGYKTTPWDDKGSYTFGSKEIWHLATAETKTHVAVFYIDPRKDGRAASAELQNSNTMGVSSYKLNKISLFSRVEYEKVSGTPVPIKNVNFQYTYDLCGQVFNNDASPCSTNFFPGIDMNANAGKLTLKKVWFTDENNTRGALSPYEFDYHERDPITYAITSENPAYSTHKYDRWGTYKSYNENSTACDNLDIPYVNQDSSLSTRSRDVAVWSLKSITNPSGGRIDITYESDDYGYVQNKTAMQMVKIVSLDSASNSATGIINHAKNADGKKRRIYFQLEKQILKTADTKAEVAKYIDPSMQVYFKVYMNLLKSSQPKFRQYVSGYANISDYNVDRSSSDISNTYYTKGYVELSNLVIAGRTTKYHPFSMAAWQHIRTNQPDLANAGGYQGDPNSSKGQARQKVGSLLSIVGEIQKVFKGYYDYSYGKGWGTIIDLNKSFIRLNSPDKIKYGGGLRVKEIALWDNWDVATSSAETKSVYGQVYDYTTIENGNKISSGVATYEPLIGGEENALRYARNYSQSVPLQTANNLFTEYPINESLYPGPSVGYRKVTVTSLATSYTGKTGGNGTLYGISSGIITTGATTSEFYTAKDFPVIAKETDIDKRPFDLFVPIPLLGQITVNHLTASQGYSVELNDMHGKLKQVSNYQQDASGVVLPEPISWVKYNYQSSTVFNNGSDRNSDYMVLNNNVSTIVSDQNGVVNKQTRTIGQDYDFFTDMRENKTFSCQGGVNLNADVILVPFPLPAFMPWPNVGTSSTMVRTAVTNKIIHRSGVLISTEAYDGSSVVKTENTYFDALTGQPIVTKTTNDFEDPIYNYSIPAHMAYYDQMGPAYKNIGITFSATLANTSSVYNIASTGASWEGLLVPGDEFIISKTSGGTEQSRGIYTGTVGTQLNFALDNTVTAGSSFNFLLVRSGRRNNLSSFAGNITALKDPTTGRRADSCVYNKTFPVPTAQVKYTFTGCAVQALDGMNFMIQNINNGTYKYSTCPDSTTWAPKEVARNSSIYTLIWPIDNSCNYNNGACKGYFTIGDRRIAGGDSTRIDLLWATVPIGWTSYGYCVPKKAYWDCLDQQSCGTQFFKLVGGTKVYINKYTIVSISKPYMDYQYSYAGESINNETSTGIAVDLQLNTGIIQKAYIVSCDRPIQWKFATSQVLLNFTPSSIKSTIYYIDSVLSSSASTFANMWGLDNTLLRDNTLFKSKYWSDTVNGGANRASFAAKNSLITGIEGINRKNESYTYVENRNQTTVLNLKKDGAFNNLPLFDWKNPALPECNPKWRKVNTITDYSPYSFENENKDILGVNSSALYDFQGSFVTAVASNASKTEIGFENFEGFKPFAKIDSNNYGPGNLTLFTNSNVNNIGSYKNYRIVSANNNYIIIDKPFDSNLDLLSATVNGYLIGTTTPIQVKGTYNVINSEKDPNNTGNTVITLDPAKMTYVGKWMGYGKFKLSTSANSPLVTLNSGSSVSISTAYAHTGKQSLYLQGSNRFEQKRLNLTPGKKYFFSSWGTNGNLNGQTFGGGFYYSGIYVTIDFLDAAKNFIPNAGISIYPSGNVIEGWQKIESEFTVPFNCVTFLLTLSGGGSYGGPTIGYFDDIRISPSTTEMKTFVYNNNNQRLQAVLDNNNYATLYYYDPAGNLFLVKKETERGIMTIQETFGHKKKH